jgi:FkbM family methyltransferase
MRHALRGVLPRPVKTLARAAAACAMFSDLRSVRRYALCRGSGVRPPSVPETVDVRVRRLGGTPVTIRTVGSDAQVLFDAFAHGYHLPPRGAVSRADATIVDLGANIGLTMAHYAQLYPAATIIGVELDHGNAILCRRNVAAWRHRCVVIEAAVWVEDGLVEYELQREAQYAMTARPLSSLQTPHTRRAPAITMPSLLAKHVRQPVVDFLKMDVEGAERQLLRQGSEWAGRVHCIKVELHDGYTADSCIADLRALGFSAWADADRAHCVNAIRQ